MIIENNTLLIENNTFLYILIYMRKHCIKILNTYVYNTLWLNDSIENLTFPYRCVGALLAGIGFMECICDCLSTPALSLIFAYTVTLYPPAVFCAIGGLLVICGVLCL